MNLSVDSGKMHPVIKIVCFLLFALFLTQARVDVIVSALMIFVFLYLYGIRFDLRSAWKMLRRMRWLFISIAVTYLWFTPGVPLVPLLQEYSPTTEGVGEAALRIATLALIVVLVNLLLHTTSREELIGAIRWLVGPLSLFGLERDRLALRMVLVLDSVDEIQALLQQQMRTFSVEGRKISRVACAMAGLFQAIIHRAETLPSRSMNVVEQEWPPCLQWLYPVILTMLFGGSLLYR